MAIQKSEKKKIALSLVCRSQLKQNYALVHGNCMHKQVLLLLISWDMKGDRGLAVMIMYMFISVHWGRCTCWTHTQWQKKKHKKTSNGDIPRSLMLLYCVRSIPGFGCGPLSYSGFFFLSPSYTRSFNHFRQLHKKKKKKKKDQDQTRCVRTWHSKILLAMA